MASAWFKNVLSAHVGTIVKLWVAASLRKHTSDYLGVSVESHSSHHFLCARCVAAEGFGLIVCLLVMVLVLCATGSASCALPIECDDCKGSGAT